MKNKMTTILSTLIATVAMAKVAEPPENIVPAPMPVIRVSDLRKNEKSVKVEKTERTVAENALFVRVCASFVFTNPNARVMQGDFEFPIPVDAVVCGYRLEVNGEMVPGVVCEKEKARVAFENETRKGVDPGLVEQVKGNLWKTRIFPLNPKTPRKAEVEFIAPKATLPPSVVYERDGDTVYRAAANQTLQQPTTQTFPEGVILWDASLSREGKVAADRARLAAQLPKQGAWKLITYSNVPDAPRFFTEKAALLAAIDAVVYDGSTELDAALATCVGEKRLVFTDELDSTDHAVSVEKLAPAEAAALKEPVAEGTMLATVWTARNAKDLASCRKYNVAGPGMSLIVLETLEQYLDNKIEPAANLAIHEEWVKLRAAEDDPIAAKKAQADHEAELLRYWEERVKWWNNPKPKIETPKSGLFDRRVMGAVGLSRSESRARSAAVPMALDAGAADNMVVEEEQVEAGDVMCEPVQCCAAPAEPKAAGAAGSGTAPSVTLKAWDPQTPYLAAIKAAKDPYAEYLVQRKAYRESPAFYLDVAGWFFNQGEAAKGLRIISNLIEFKLENAPLWRTMGWRLREAAEKMNDASVRDLTVKTFRHVKEMRGEEGQSFRDLATVLTERAKAKAAAGNKSGAACDLSEAAALLKEAAFTDHRRRAARRTNDFQVSVFALEDLNGLLGWYAANKDKVGAFTAPELDAAYRRDLPVKLRIVMTWDADETDIDLHVLEPNGEECFYGHRRTREGGFCSEDVTTGYGPEEYLKKDLEKGTYKVLTNYYASHQTSLTGATTVQAAVYTDWATAQEKMQLLTLRLDKPKDKQLVGEVTMSE